MSLRELAISEPFSILASFPCVLNVMNVFQNMVYNLSVSVSFSLSLTHSSSNGHKSVTP
ncbi:hypothetical protein E2C01_021862 [Portunus trituberculatus]|uniref:Uncharacterized protein n=1 Tax=Portunus trituberculatus TaxID=210409 RepID=A0A5B7E3Q4_PORTR|nr:hypothetical protein [Portunus trituberculatus]